MASSEYGNSTSPATTSELRIRDDIDWWRRQLRRGAAQHRQCDDLGPFCVHGVIKFNGIPVRNLYPFGRRGTNLFLQLPAQEGQHSLRDGIGIIGERPVTTAR